tara:strand:+ start:1314 stop:2534 length:1221 start_codon:yes stop_codon:yes gene_type:complete
MKKQLFLSLLVIVFTGNSFAQNIIETNQQHDRKVIENYTPNNNSKAGGGWFNYGRELQDGGSLDATGYIGVLHTDSSMIDGYIDSNGDTNYYSVYQHSRGQILDPTSFNFINTGEADFFNPSEGFILDTIQFPYEYIRTQDQIPDKLIVQIYSSDAGITQGSFVGGDTFYHAEYDYTTNEGKNAYQTIEYDLTINDTTGPGNTKYQTFTIDPPLAMPNGGLVAATYTFVSGNTFSPGDTLASYDMPWVVNQRNSFIGYYVSDDAATQDPGYENYALHVSSDVQYNNNSNGWNGSYIPGMAYTATQHQNIWFHLTSTGSTNTNNISTANINLYPNPVNDKINIAFNNTNEVQNITITDVTGRTIHTEKVTSNTNVVTVNTSNYPSGIYFCEIKGVSTVETIKFTKTK